MRKLLAMTAGMMLMASGAMAQGALHMTWNACPNTVGAAPGISFDCDPTHSYDLYGTFTFTAAVPGIVAMDATIDWRFPEFATFPEFWQFQQGGCNETGLLATDARPTTTYCSTNNSARLCGTDGVDCDVVWVYNILSPPTPSYENKARLLITVARSSTSPVIMPANVAPSQHFAFGIRIEQDNAVGGGLNECTRCEAEGCLTWTQATFYNTLATSREEGVAVSLYSYTPGSDANVGMNYGCLSTPTNTRTWGRLKSLYR